MTDKQIIIDGIDVCRCRYYDDRYGYCEACRDDIDGNSYTKCMYEDNCYYKQLKRDEQRIVELNKTIQAKEQECEKLRFPMKDTNYAILTKEEFEKFEQLKQTLTEIKEIVEHCINKDICTFCDYSDRCYIEDEEIPTYDVCKLILEKISEVEE